MCFIFCSVPEQIPGVQRVTWDAPQSEMLTLRLIFCVGGEAPEQAVRYDFVAEYFSFFGREIMFCGNGIIVAREGNTAGHTGGAGEYGIPRFIYLVGIDLGVWAPGLFFCMGSPQYLNAVRAKAHISEVGTGAAA